MGQPLGDGPPLTTGEASQSLQSLLRSTESEEANAYCWLSSARRGRCGTVVNRSFRIDISLGCIDRQQAATRMAVG